MTTPAARKLYARAAALTRWSQQDAVAGTEPARAAFLQRFIDQVDPDGSLRRRDPDEAQRRAWRARSAHFSRLAALSIEARTRKREGGRNDA